MPTFRANGTLCARLVEDCKVKYLECLLLGAKEHAKGENLLERGLRALYQLSKEQGSDKYYTLEEIRRFSGIKPNQSATGGLWGWLNEYGAVKIGAGIVERRDGGQPRAYRIRKEFYEAVGKVLGDGV